MLCHEVDIVQGRSVGYSLRCQAVVLNCIIVGVGMLLRSALSVRQYCRVLLVVRRLKFVLCLGVLEGLAVRLGACFAARARGVLLLRVREFNFSCRVR